MKNLLCFFFLTAFLTKRVTGLDCYTTKDFEEIKPCFDANKNLPETEQIEANLKCLTDSKPQLQPCKDTECYTLTIESDGKKASAYGCGKYSCEIDKFTYAMLVFRTMPNTKANCDDCNTDKCNKGDEQIRKKHESVKKTAKSKNGVFCIVPNTTVIAVLIVFCFVLNFIL